MKLTKHDKVAASLTDYKANLSSLGAFGIVEDAITEFMGDHKVDGLTAKRVYNAVWVFAKTKIKFLKNIEWQNEYNVVCFFSRISNATVDIDVGIKNSEDELCVYSRTEICALDLQTGRIRRVSTVGIDDSFQTEAPLSDIAFTKIDTENLPIEEQVKIRYTNIDYAGHTNNKEYIRFMLNTYSVREMDEQPIREMQIVYANQSYEGDTLTLHKGRFDNKEVFAIQKDNKDIVKCEIVRDGVVA